ncbi:cytochrome P450 [Neolentinus lepideus HHB14362 ss-1]|uniref:Cytochrome P450 n=1 Tax=Neolentinus lepideus HHB14362 ss-1 TaxID=1314782 RepID=A0A165VRS9_9AGAM|nr:cytochrome P450 [Neolentinus lepideus HHB14362 ss-1]
MTIQLTYLLVPIILAWVAYRLLRRSPLANIPGPQPEPFFGNVRHMVERSNVDVMFEWQEQYGSVFRVQSFLGLNKLVIADPKAIQYVLNAAAYDFPKPAPLRAFIIALSGPHLIWAEGDVHKKQRRIMSPAFGAYEMKALHPVFKHHAENLVAQWKDALVNTDDNESRVIDVHRSLNSTTLNALCEAAFNFRAENENGNILKEIYMNFNENVFPPYLATMNGIMDHLPAWVIPPLLKVLPTKNMAFVRRHKRETYRIAEELVAEKADTISSDTGKRDVFSLLVQANKSEYVKNLQLSDDELYAQMSLVFAAGHATTAGTMTFALWQLVKHVDVQTQLRNEIREIQATVHGRGKTELTADDLENMVYLQAVLKETLRMHPAIFQVARVATKDAVLPLSQPVKTSAGELISQIAVPRGTEIIVSPGCYNRNKSVWGEDAEDFNPQRWLTGERQSKAGISLGVLGNLMSFWSGTKSCLGWRFAMVEMQCFLVEIVNHFELRPTRNVHAYGSNLMYPLVEGEEEKGAQMPLRVSVASRD